MSGADGMGSLAEAPSLAEGFETSDYYDAVVATLTPRATRAREVAGGLVVDVVAATLTASLVAPLTAFLDRGITESAAGKTRLWVSVYESAKAACARPAAFLRSPQYFWPFALYAGTYSVANGAETICDGVGVDRAGPQLAASTATNMSLSMAKDSAFARIFGTIVPTSLPAASYGLWLGRDVLSMYFFFTLPPLLLRGIAETAGADGAVAAVAAPAALFMSPVFAQFFTTPLHIAGLDQYNRKGATIAQRLSFLRTEFPVAIGARVARIMPAYSIGGVCNAAVRDAGRGGPKHN